MKKMGEFYEDTVEDILEEFTMDMYLKHIT